MGDPAGIGPELCVRLLFESERDDTAEQVPLIFGDATILKKVSDCIGVPIVSPVVSPTMAINKPAIVHCPTESLKEFVPGHVQAACGEASFQYCLEAIAQAKQNTISDRYLPDKQGSSCPGSHVYPGHTELFSEHLQTRNLHDATCTDIACSFVTTHIGYTEVTEQLTSERIGAVLAHILCLTDNSWNCSKTSVCGLNPHAGEHGLFGN